jgi:Tat protein secretion system quality control protein TatD with DNase activity
VPEQQKRKVVFRDSHSEEPTIKRLKVRDIPEVSFFSDIGHHLTMVSAYDTHFHLDRMSKLIFGDSSLTVTSVVTEQLERPPLIPVNMEGGVLIYCDPETYSINMPIDTKWKVAVGMHPKTVAKCSEAEVKKFIDLIKNTRVSAVGEVGLDISLRDGTRKVQEEFLIQVLHHVKPRIPLILYIRSTRPVKYSRGLYLRDLDILRVHCHPTQNIILHCFTGEESVRSELSNQFPNVFFSFSSILKQYYQEQLKAVKNIAVTRLLHHTCYQARRCD